MKASIKILLFFSLAFGSIPTFATHLVGGYMGYTYLGVAPNGNTRYRVKVNVYRDCFQSDVPFDQEIPLGIYLNNKNRDLHKIEKLSLGTVTNVKPPGSSDCDYYAKNVCIEYGYYEGVIELPPYSAGYHLTFVRCCRNHQKNIPDQNGEPFQGQTYYCFIPNNTLNNTSPAFSAIPSAYICARDTATLVFNAVDIDGDELSYKLVHPYQGGEPTTGGSIPDPPDSLVFPIDPIFYNTNYNAQFPFGINNGSYTSIDSITGLAKIVAVENGSYVLAVEVTEKRNDTILSVVRMDLQVLVLDCPTNQVPTISASTNKQVHVEAGEKLCITILGKDADNDEVELSADGIVLSGKSGFTGTKATFPSAVNVAQVSSTFCWDTDCAHARIEPYVVTFKAEDNGCPPKSTYLDIAIYVDSFAGATKLSGPNNVCRYNAYWYELIGGRPTSKYHWEVTNGVKSSIDSLNRLLIDWEYSGVGEIRVREESKNGCLGEWVYLKVNIKESPNLTSIVGKDTVCINEVGLEYSVTQNSNYTYKWFVENASFSPVSTTKIKIDQYQKPSFKVKLLETNDIGCGGDTAILEVFVSEPNPEIIGPTSVCPNANNIKYSVENNYLSTYLWSVEDGTLVSGNGTNEIRVNWGLEGLGSVSVTETNRHGCVSAEKTLDVLKTYSLTSNPILGDREVCEFETEKYATLNVDGSTYAWSVAGGSQITGDSSSSITINWGKSGLGSVTVQEKAFDAVNNKACLSDKIELPIIIHPKPSIDTIFGQNEICEDLDSLLYFVNGLPNSTFTWKINGEELDGDLFTTDSIYLKWNTSGVFILSVTEISDKGCEGETINKQILVNPKPRTTPILGNKIICPETLLNQEYTVTGFANSQFRWFVNGAQSIQSTTLPSIEIDWSLNYSNADVNVVEISDKGCIGDTVRLPVTLDLLAIDLRFVSVGYPDNYVIIDWVIGDSMQANGFKIQKRNPVEGNTWTNVLSTNGDEFSVIESGVNTDSAAFEYRVIATNRCGTLVSSEIHKLVLLSGYTKADQDLSLTFSAYEGWQSGVNSYSLFESINNAPYFEKYTFIEPNVSLTEISNLALYKRCYRILATEKDGELTESWSNEICFLFEPQLFVPNAFTANDDGLNDQFAVKGIAINQFNLKIYSRWGELVFETTDINEAWNPVYMNKEVQSGVYLVVVSYTDYNDTVYTKSGTVQLIR